MRKESVFSASFIFVRIQYIGETLRIPLNLAEVSVFNTLPEDTLEKGKLSPLFKRFFSDGRSVYDTICCKVSHNISLFRGHAPKVTDEVFRQILRICSYKSEDAAMMRPIKAVSAVLYIFPCHSLFHSLP